MAIEIFDDVDCNLNQEFFDKIYLAYLDNLGLKDVFDIELSIVDGDTIKETNAMTRNVDSVTDVLSFPNLEMKFPFRQKDYKDFDRNPQTGNLFLGEIMLCQSRAQEQAQEYGHSFERECGYLFLHGLLHLAGFDHMTEQDKPIMRKHEEEILNSLGIVRE